MLPGFIDSHVHFMGDGDLDPMTFLSTPFSTNFYLAAERMARTLAAGVTTVREAGGSDLGVKEAQARGIVPGPSMLISITILSQTGGHGDSWMACGADVPFFALPHPGRPSNFVDGAEEMRRKVRELVRAGADVIKVVHRRAACCHRATTRVTATSATTSSTCSSPKRPRPASG